MLDRPTEIQRKFAWDDRHSSLSGERLAPLEEGALREPVTSPSLTGSAWLIGEIIGEGSASLEVFLVGHAIARNVRLTDLADIRYSEMQQVAPGIQYHEYRRLMAAIELGRRVAEAKLDRGFLQNAIRSSGDAREFCERHFRRLATDRLQEEFHIVTLSTKNFVIGTHQITVGTLDASLVHPREVFRPAIRDAASSIIAVHNHPSGDPTPSREDKAVTERLRTAGETLGIGLLDHIVVASSGSVSLSEK